MFNPSIISRFRTPCIYSMMGSIIGAFILYGPIAQVPQYNNFANQYIWLGIPHAENVLTNLPFLFLGIFGICRSNRYKIYSNMERIAWCGFFIGLIFTAIGSAYYHLEPTNFRLIWDRIPITFTFICLFTAILAERVSTTLAKFSFLPMLLYSILAVYYWYYTQSIGIGDLRPYIIVQLLPIILIPMFMAFYRGKYSHGWMLLVVAFWYVLAKVFEGFDSFIYQWLGHMSGHGIKHLFAAMACAQIIWMLEKREYLFSHS